MNKIRLLIASDFRLPRIGLRKIVSAAADLEVVAECQVQNSLLHTAKQFNPHVILLELAIPRSNSVAAITPLLKDSPAKAVVISANENVSYVRSLFAAGALGYVLRNAGEEELFSAIRSVRQGRYFIDPQLSDGLADVLVNPRTNARPSPANSLSKREIQVLTAIAHGFTSSQIAGQLQISPKTVETYRSRIYEKLELKTRADLVAHALASGLLIGGEARES